MRTGWRVREVDAGAVRSLARCTRLPEVVVRLLVARGHREADAAMRHLTASAAGLHDPELLPGMGAACERLLRALRDRETVLVHGDYDVDGVTGTVLLVRLFRVLGARVAWHVPNRLVHGYSFGDHSIERARETGATVVISVDNGTSAGDVIARLAERGVDTIVTDHHEPPDGPLPDAAALVNPKLPDSTYPWRELCGGAVAFKLAWGLARAVTGRRRVSEELKRFLDDALSYVAIATVCDVVPLLDENRIFARYGIRALQASRSPGLRALVAVSGAAGRPLTAEDVAFRIGPRINASGRLGSARRAIELLLCDGDDDARRLAGELDALNDERRRIEEGVLAEARAAAAALPADDPVLVVAGQGWHQGVVGIVAARLVEAFGKPALVIGLDGDAGRGSGRAPDGFPLLDALHGGAEHMERYGGHARAAGCEVRADAVDALRRAVCERARALVVGGDGAGPSGLEVDAELPFEGMTPELMHALGRLEPWGEGNAEPLFLSRDLRLAEPARAVGVEGEHLLCRLRRGPHVLKGLAFRAGHRLEELRMGAPLDVVYTPRWNTFRGETALELTLRDFA